jgi:hypothetical protein
MNEQRIEKIAANIIAAAKVVVYTWPSGFAKEAENMYKWLRHYGMNPSWGNVRGGEATIELPKDEVSALQELQKANPARFGNWRKYEASSRTADVPVNPSAAKRDVANRLSKAGIEFRSLSAKSTSFSGFGYGVGLFVSIHGAILPIGWKTNLFADVPKPSEGGYIVQLGRDCKIQREDGTTFVPMMSSFRDDEDEVVVCSACGSEQLESQCLLGGLGNRKHYRCRHCGITWSEVKASISYPSNYFFRPGARNWAGPHWGLMDIENDDLTGLGLAAKLQEIQEADGGVDAYIYDDAKERMIEDGVKMPVNIRRASSRNAPIAERVAKNFAGMEFDTKKEMDDYKREHDVRPGTKMTVKPEDKEPAKKDTAKNALSSGGISSIKSRLQAYTEKVKKEKDRSYQKTLLGDIEDYNGILEYIEKGNNEAAEVTFGKMDTAARDQFLDLVPRNIRKQVAEIVGTEMMPAGMREASIAERIARSFFANKFQRGDIVYLQKNGKATKTKIIEKHFNGGKWAYTVEGEDSPVAEVELDFK